ncbi:putative ribonuclease H-like domain-containing protein, partial [Tanacetum coccineum]
GNPQQKEYKEKGVIDSGQAEKKHKPEQEFILIPFYTIDPLISQGPKDSKEDSGMKPTDRYDKNKKSQRKPFKNANTKHENEDVQEPEAKSKDKAPSTMGQPSAEALFAYLSIPVSAAGPSFTNDDQLLELEGLEWKHWDFCLLKVWTLVDLPNGIGTKWVFRNKKDERGIVVRNKARLVAQGFTQEEGIDYYEDFAHVARIESIRLFLAYASFMGFIVYQMDVKSAFLYGTIEEEVYVDDIIFGLTKKSLCDEFEGLMHKIFQITDILKKFDFATVKTVSTPMEPNKALIKDEEADSVDVRLYRSMIGSLMYLTASWPDIMFAIYACARFQVTPKMSHLYAVKRIFRYLKGQPKLGLWYPRDLPFDLEAFSDSDYVGASLNRKSTTGGCQFLGKRLISWQCKKQTIVANSTNESKYVAAANCCGQVLWIQNQMLDYGFNFMNTKIFFDNESTICIVKNPVFHSKT